MRYKQPWCAKSDASTILLLPGEKRGCFDVNGGTHLRDTMSEMSMQTLAVGGQFSLRSGVLSPGRFVPLAFFPAQTGGAVLLDTALFVVVVGISSAALAVHCARHSPFFPGIRCQFLAERDQVGFALTRHNRQGGRANIQADDVFAHCLMLGFDERVAFEHQLHVIAIAIFVGSLRSR